MRMVQNKGLTKVWLSARETRAWARKPGAIWPCSFLSGRAVVAEFDPRGDLVDLSIDGGKGDQDCPCDEFNAIMEDMVGTSRPSEKMSFGDRIILRKWKATIGQGIVALFPEIAIDQHGTLCQSYEHIGQHGVADVDNVMQLSRPASLDDAKDLLDELRMRGYIRPRIVQRESRTMRETRVGYAKRHFNYSEVK